MWTSGTPSTLVRSAGRSVQKSAASQEPMETVTCAAIHQEEST